MPISVEKRLWRKAKERFPDDEIRQREYVYGTLRKMGWKPKAEREKTS